MKEEEECHPLCKGTYDASVLLYINSCTEIFCSKFLEVIYEAKSPQMNKFFTKSKTFQALRMLYFQMAFPHVGNFRKLTSIAFIQSGKLSLVNMSIDNFCKSKHKFRIDYTKVFILEFPKSNRYYPFLLKLNCRRAAIFNRTFSIPTSKFEAQPPFQKP